MRWRKSRGDPTGRTNGGKRDETRQGSALFFIVTPNKFYNKEVLSRICREFLESEAVEWQQNALLQPFQVNLWRSIAAWEQSL
jgi:hypothetical protein